MNPQKAEVEKQVCVIPGKPMTKTNRNTLRIATTPPKMSSNKAEGVPLQRSQADKDTHEEDHHDVVCHENGKRGGVELSQWLDIGSGTTRHIGRMGTASRVNWDGDEDGDGGLARNMTGAQWEKLLFPIIIDSGAMHSTMPTERGNHIPEESPPRPEVGSFSGQRTESKPRMKDNGWCQ